MSVATVVSVNYDIHSTGTLLTIQSTNTGFVKNLPVEEVKRSGIAMALGQVAAGFSRRIGSSDVRVSRA